jgi:hypothetical protein
MLNALPSSCRWIIAFCSLLVLDLQALFPQERPLRQIIDAEIKAAWQSHSIKPAGRADDATFLRRIFLDLVGTIPTETEAKQFLVDADSAKREKLIDKLLADQRYAIQQANVWDQVLFGRNPANGDATRKRDGFKKWLTDQFAKNQAYDHWVRDLLLAEQAGSELYYVQYRNQPEDATVAISRIFLGVQLQCARCHDHPFENWSQKDFYGMAGFLVRLVVFEEGTGEKRKFTVAEKSTGEVLFSGAVKDQKPGQKGEPVKPKLLNGSTLDEPALPKDFKEPNFAATKSLPKPKFSRKEKLVEWLVDLKNPYFARAVCNRVWSQFMGRGLVHPVDDLSEKNRPSHPELFQLMTDQLVARKFDLKWLIRELVNSEAYQLASSGPSAEAAPHWFERARVRPLSVEEMMSSLRIATRVDADAKTPGAKPAYIGEEYFAIYFGEPTNGLGEFQGRLSEHLFMNNSEHVQRVIRRKKGNLADLLSDNKEPFESRVDRLFLSVLTRLPTDEQRARFVKHLKLDAKTEPLIEEAIWVLLNTSEFRFNH